MLLIVLGVMILVIWAYVLFVRDWLYAKFPDTTFGRLHDLSNKLWSNSRTILVARFYWVAGILVTLQGLMASAGIDVTPFITELAKAIPEGYRTAAISGFMIITGVTFEWLRRVTANPVGDQSGADK